jgi:hypothetical protein
VTIDIVDVLQIAPPIDFEAVDDTAVPATEDFRTSLRAFLLASEGLEDLEGRIYWSNSPPSVEYPFMILSRLWEKTIIITTHVFYRECAYQFTIFSFDDEQAETLTEAAHNALLPIEDYDPIRFIGGYESSRKPGRVIGPDSQPMGMIGGETVWRCSFDYEFILGNS